MGIGKSSRIIRVANIIEEGKLGGPQIRIITVAAKMHDQVETTVIMPTENSEWFVNACISEEIKYKTLPISRITKEWTVALRYIFFSIFEIAQITKLLKSEKFDLIHVSGGSWQYKGVIAGKLANVPVLWHINDTSMPRLLRKLFSIISPMADGFIFASECSKQYYQPILKRALPSFVIPSPVDTMTFNPKVVNPYEGKLKSLFKDKIVIGTVANVNPVKGLEHLIKVASELNDSFQDIYFLVIGAIYQNQSGYFKKLKKLAAELGVENILFLGGQSDIKELLKTIDIYFCSSISESSPIAVWEAMAMGKPVVSTAVGDVPLYIENCINGFVVDVGNIDEMVRCLSIYISEEKLREQHGKLAREVSVRHLDVAHCAYRHIQAYSVVSNITPSNFNHVKKNRL